ATLTAPCAATASVTSSSTARICSPYCSRRSANCCGLRAVATTLSPAASAALTISRPRPRPLPVTSQTFDMCTSLDPATAPGLHYLYMSDHSLIQEAHRTKSGGAFLGSPGLFRLQRVPECLEPRLAVLLG